MAYTCELMVKWGTYKMNLVVILDLPLSRYDQVYW